MKRKFITIQLLIITLLLSSCGTSRMFTTIDVLRPAEVSFSPTAQNVLIINNAVVQPYNLGHYEFSSQNDFAKPTHVTLEFDSAAVFCIASLRENLEAKNFFNSVNISETQTNSSDDFYKITPLTSPTVRYLCNLYHVEAIVSLDHIMLTDRTVVTSLSDELGSTDVLVETKWSVHYPNEATASLEFTDEFSWEEENKSNMPSRYNILIDACILTGSNIADRMIPRWEKQERYFYNPKTPEFMQQGMSYLTKREWNKAIEEWDKADDKQGYKIRYYAANNKAIAYEILGDLDNAIKNAENAVGYYQNILFAAPPQNEVIGLMEYFRFLKKRKEELKLINKQLGE